MGKLITLQIACGIRLLATASILYENLSDF